MNEFFKNATEIKVEGATLPFYKFSEDGVEYIGFDSRKCVPPEPMVNALVALNLIADSKSKVMMINHHYPVALIPKIEHSYDISHEKLEGEEVKVIISLKEGASAQTLDTNVKCGG
ncbi:hypothetical protein [Campylobacter sp. RM16190]|uniref:hypothetical protein n=1 Tax=Campylobacter sp. RM16190 TaxID=1705727 RepID=UPI00147642BE|nr:hypothetical protein [Campylobacter sp. RM16190]